MHLGIQNQRSENRRRIVHLGIQDQRSRNQGTQHQSKRASKRKKHRESRKTALSNALSRRNRRPPKTVGKEMKAKAKGASWLLPEQHGTTCFLRSLFHSELSSSPSSSSSPHQMLRILMMMNASSTLETPQVT